MVITFDTNGNNKQKDVAKLWINDTTSDIVYGGSKGSGKSYLGVSLIFGDAFIYPNTHYFIARKELNNIRKYTIPSIMEVFESWGITPKHYNFNGQDNYYTLYNESKVYLLDAKYLPRDPQYYRFGSMQMTRGWIEEAGEFEENAKNNLAASIGRWKNNEYNLTPKLLQTCNPSKNYLYSQYYKKHKNGSIENHKEFVQALPSDNKMLQDGYLRNLELSLSKNQKERLLKGNWEYDDDPDALCDYDSIHAIFENDHIEKGTKYLTADIARFGSDKAIVGVWDSWNLIEVHVFEVSKMTDIQTCIQAMRTKHSIAKHNCVADEDGVGGGVVDNCGIVGFVNNSSPLKETSNIGGALGQTYFNLQTQCAYKLADRINGHTINISCELQGKYKEEIIEELEQLKSYKSDTEGKLRILPKDKIKDNIGRSPDWRDLLLMRVIFELKKGYGKYVVV
jgi:phage terminase large subunit